MQNSPVGTGSLQVLGADVDPFAGRLWVRTFADGQKEFLYRACDGPSQLEQFNAWMRDAGLPAARDLGLPRVPLTLAEEQERRAAFESTPEENSARIARRARQKVRWSVKAIGCDQMLTLTYRENITDKAASTEHFRKFSALCRKEWPTWRYVAAPEPQKRGAWHWHIAVRGYVNYDKLRGFWWRAMGYRVTWSTEGKPVLLDVSETPGNVQGVSAFNRGQKRRTWDVDRAAGYLAKYVSKTLESGDGAKSYSVSRGLSWTLQRYVIRALTFEGVASAWLDAFSTHGVASPYLWQHPHGLVMWAAGSSLEPP